MGVVSDNGRFPYFQSSSVPKFSEEERRPPWQKVLYLHQPYEDGRSAATVIVQVVAVVVVVVVVVVLLLLLLLLLLVLLLAIVVIVAIVIIIIIILINNNNNSSNCNCNDSNIFMLLGRMVRVAMRTAARLTLNHLIHQMCCVCLQALDLFVCVHKDSSICVYVCLYVFICVYICIITLKPLYMFTRIALVNTVYLIVPMNTSSYRACTL